MRFCGVCLVHFFLFWVGCLDGLVSSSSSPNRSSWRSATSRRSAIQSVRGVNPLGSSRQVRTRPIFSLRISPLASSTCRCCMTAAKVMSKGLARSVTVAGLRLSRSTIARRVGSTKARNVISTSGQLSMGLSIHLPASIVKFLLKYQPNLSLPPVSCCPRRSPRWRALSSRDPICLGHRIFAKN